MATVYDKESSNILEIISEAYKVLAATPSSRHERREANINMLRKAFGDAADSPTMGYYRALPDLALKTFTNQALKLQTRLMCDGALTLGSLYAAGGSLAFGLKGLAVGFAVATAGLAIDTVRTNHQQNKLQQKVFDFKAE